jgi:citrate lyase beta subunit
MTAPSTLSAHRARTDEILGRLEEANARIARRYPGEPAARQPLHTVYGGANLFRADTVRKMGEIAVRALAEHGPDFATFARALALPGAESLPTTTAEIAALSAQIEAEPEAVRAGNRAAWLTWTVYTRVLAKLGREPVEDFRIDFEDGYGNRPDAEEDGHAVQAANEVANGMAAGSLPPFIGIRIKPFNEEQRRRSVRTLDVFLTALVQATGGRLPDNFVVTLPKVTVAAQVTALVELFEVLEHGLGLPAGALKAELMIETTQSIIGPDGEITLGRLVDAGRGRITGAHFGTYDYTAGCNITAAHQRMRHPVCEFARHMMQVALARTGIVTSDGATNVMPIGPHRASAGGALTAQQHLENRAVVHAAWKLAFDDVTDSLFRGFYQGWDLHPAQLPVRYAAVFAFFLAGIDAAAERLRTFVQKAAQATLVGDVFDDAATGQGLLNFFLRAINAGALTEEETQALTSLSIAELRSRSFVAILDGRKR